MDEATNSLTELDNSWLAAANSANVSESRDPALLTLAGEGPSEVLGDEGDLGFLFGMMESWETKTEKKSGEWMMLRKKDEWRFGYTLSMRRLRT